MRDLVKFQPFGMPSPAPKDSTTLNRWRIAARDCARVLPSGDLDSIAGTMQLVRERNCLGRGSSRYVKKLVVTFNKAVAGSKEGSTLRMPRELNDDNTDINDMAVWTWLPPVNSMEALWRRELQGIVMYNMQEASHEVDVSFFLATALL
jgi:hypothetical protein